MVAFIGTLTHGPEIEPIALTWIKQRYARQLKQEKRIADKEREVAEAEAQEEKCYSTLRDADIGTGRP